MTAPHKLANSLKTFLDRDNWMRAVLAADLPDNAKAVALTIALHLRVKTGTCNPSYPTLAAESHVGERSTYRLVALLESAGWLSVLRTQGRLSNQYVLLNPASHVAGLNPAKTRHPNPAKSTLQPCQQAAGKKRKRRPSGESLRSLQREGERVRASREDSSPSAGAPPLPRHPAGLSPAESAQAQSQTEPVAAKGPSEGECAEKAENKTKTEPAARESDERWRELQAMWQRGHLSDNDPKTLAIGKQVFMKSCREGADPGEIIEAARVWVAAFEAGDGVRYLDPLPRWLGAKGWETPPPTKRKRANSTRYAPGRRSDGLPRTNGNKVDTAKVFFEMAGYVEDDDGNMVRGDVQ